MDQILTPSGTSMEPAPALYASFPRRIQAVVLDGVLLILLLLAGSTLAGSLGAPSAARLLNLILLLSLLLYEPVLLSSTGATVGQRVLNLRVVAEPNGGKLSFARALLRSAVKAGFGIVSFFFMLVSRRHQALHDLLANSTVQPRDFTSASSVYYLPEREEEVQEVRAPAIRRAIIILGYCLFVYLGISVAALPFASDACMVYNQCTPGETSLFIALGLVWVALSILVVRLGWLGRLPGARSRNAALN